MASKAPVAAAPLDLDTALEPDGLARLSTLRKQVMSGSISAEAFHRGAAPLFAASDEHYALYRRLVERMPDETKRDQLLQLIKTSVHPSTAAPQANTSPASPVPSKHASAGNNGATPGDSSFLPTPKSKGSTGAMYGTATGKIPRTCDDGMMMGC